MDPVKSDVLCEHLRLGDGHSAELGTTCSLHALRSLALFMGHCLSLTI
ncbi:jg3561, partial [Pararge aegeria aegeria]